MNEGQKKTFFVIAMAVFLLGYSAVIGLFYKTNKEPEKTEPAPAEEQLEEKADKEPKAEEQNNTVSENEFDMDIASLLSGDLSMAQMRILASKYIQNNDKVKGLKEEQQKRAEKVEKAKKDRILMEDMITLSEKDVIFMIEVMGFDRTADKLEVFADLDLTENFFSDKDAREIKDNATDDKHLSYTITYDTWIIRIVGDHLYAMPASAMIFGCSDLYGNKVPALSVSEDYLIVEDGNIYEVSKEEALLSDRIPLIEKTENIDKAVLDQYKKDHEDLFNMEKVVDNMLEPVFE